MYFILPGLLICFSTMNVDSGFRLGPLPGVKQGHIASVRDVSGNILRCPQISGLSAASKSVPTVGGRGLQRTSWRSFSFRNILLATIPISTALWLVFSFFKSGPVNAATSTVPWDLYGRVPFDDWMFSTWTLTDPNLLKRSFVECVRVSSLDCRPDVSAD